LVFGLEASAGTNLLEGQRRGPFLSDTDLDIHPWKLREVVWYTSDDVVGRVRYGTDPLNLNLLASDSAAKYEHRVTLANLLPSTVYNYSAFNDLDNDSMEDPGEGYDTGFFKTVAQPNPAAAQMQPFKFIAFGDSGCTGLGSCTSGNNSACCQDAVKSLIENFASCPDFVIHLGDIVYENGELGKIEQRYYVPYQNLVNKMPVFLSPGNHDVHTAEGNANRRNFFASYVLPTNNAGVEVETERFYSFDYGNIHFVMLDGTTIGIDTGNIADENNAFFQDCKQLCWLCQDLAAARRFWKVVFFHHPPFTSNRTSDSQMIQDQLRPLFNQYRVDLVINGHAHYYERTRNVITGTEVGDQDICPPVGGTKTFDNTPRVNFGTIYLTTGGGGRSLNNTDSPTPIAPSDVVFKKDCTSSVFHVTEVTSGRDATTGRFMLTIKPINKDVVTLETVTLTKNYPPFLRGDSNGDGVLDISDPNHLYLFLFNGTVSPNCLDASDVNDDGQVDVSDPAYLLNYLFQGGPPPPAPGDASCGPDPTPDVLSCEFYAASTFPSCEAPFSSTCVSLPSTCPPSACD
jgi:predicted phosphodiesterase